MWPFPKRRDFYKLLADQTDKTAETMKAFNDFMQNPTPESGKKVYDLEEEADELRRVLVEELNSSFVTPIDREDIFTLSRAIDDMADYGKSTVEEMTLFEVKTNDSLKKIAEELYNCAREMALAVKHMKDHPQVCTDHIVRAKKTENFVEHRYREALAELFKTDNVVNILKMREIYRHLSNAADRADEAANILGDILVKTT